MANANELKAIIFDFDGVIVESLDVKTEAFRTLFAEHSDHVDRIVQLHLDTLGASRYEKFKIIYRDFLEQPLDDAEMRRLDHRFSELVYERVISCRFVAGAPEFLNRVWLDHSLYVASATPQDELARIVKARGLFPYFAAVRGSPGAKDEIIGEILASDGVQPGEAVVVGDAVTDYRAALRNDASFIGRVPAGAPNPFSDAAVDTVRDLTELQERWREILARLGFKT